MKRSILLLLAFWMAACSTTSTTTEPDHEPVPIIERKSALKPAEPPPLLWEVEGPNGPLYLFGTMHFGVAPDALPSTVFDKLEQCDLFVIEASPEGADPVELADMMMLTDGPSNDEVLGPQRWERLLELIDGAFEPRVARRLRPWVLEAVLIRRVVPDDTPMEFELLSDARQRTMEVEYLETWKTQVQMLNDATGIDALTEILDDPDAFAARMQQMTDDYLQGDVDALERHIFALEHDQHALFSERNATWVPRLEELARRGNAFVAVGAGHLLGDHSVVEMLRDRGYEVRRVGVRPSRKSDGS